MSMSDTDENEEEQSTTGVLPELARICDEDGSWVEIDPPTEVQERETPSIIGNWDGKPIKTGFIIEDRTSENEDADTLSYKVYRTSKYNIHFRVREIEYTEETDFNEEGFTDENGEIVLEVPDKGETAGTLNVVALDDQSSGWFSSEDKSPEDFSALEGVSGDDYIIEVDGEVEAGNEVTVSVTESGEPVRGVAVYQEGPVKLATGEVFVRQVEGYK